MERSDVELLLPGGSSVSLRPVTPADEEFLLRVYASTREVELAQFAWAEGQKELFVSWQFGLQRREYETRFPDAQYNTILVDGQPAGRIWVGRDDKQIRLLDIALLPEFQNRGVGTVLLRRLMDESKTAKGSDVSFFECLFQSQRGAFLKLFPNGAEILASQSIPESTLR